MPTLELHNIPVDAASFLVTPAVVVTQGVCECCDEPKPSFLITVQWLMWGFGISLTFDSSHE